MTPRQTVRAAINHEETERVPYTVGVEDPDLSDRLDTHFGGNWRSGLTNYMASVGSVDSVQVKPVDEVHARDAYGAIWRMDRRPWHLERPAVDRPSFEGYEFPGPEVFAVPGLAERGRKLAADNADRFLVAHNGWGIWEICWRIRGFENALMDSALEEDFFQELVDKLTESRLAMVAQFADIPADAIMFGDDWGDQRGVTIGPERWRRFLKPAWAKVYGAVHAQGKIAMSHCCGSIADILPDIIEIGLDVLESVQPEPEGMNPYELKKRFGDRITFWGAVGSQSVVQFMKPDEIRSHVRRLAHDMSRGGGYILAPAKALQPGTPFENAVALMEALADL
jgi:uroporphyrinogen decarboxylase